MSFNSKYGDAVYNIKAIFIVAVLSGITLSVNAQKEGVEYNWKEKRNKKGISISTSKVEGSKYKAIRGVMIVKGTVKELVALIHDLDECSEWAEMCRESRIVTRVSDTSHYIYVRNDVPFPLTDRDIYTHVTWTHNQNTGKVSMLSTASEDEKMMPKKKGIIRIKNALSQWHFTPKLDGTVLVESFAHIDPAGVSPPWLTNRLIIDSPYKTMKKMRELIESGKYVDSEVSFLK